MHPTLVMGYLDLHLHQELVAMSSYSAKLIYTLYLI